MVLQRARDAAFSVLAARGFHSFGHGSRILLPFRTGNPDLISIGSGVIIGPGSWLMSPERSHPAPVIELRDRSRINQTSITAVQSVIIEEGVDIARGCYITDHSHGFDDPDAFIRDQPLVRVAPVRICRGAWLGQNVVVLPGVTIGENAVVGANSVVREDVPPRAVVAGVPARVIRQLA
ncbi:acyltransferase [Protaetiibacter mangrovi]|uniref:Acyltransferase n=1 Tax=Protaetiibacter mangrovi TaxID=2970926 RepID=A0ABT1ZBG7_9MICO|nr:acyltransferase [Protaetiibacter mangrovi]MCS0498042.1 acyltransferase [Protaetiibacter mangrovi]